MTADRSAAQLVPAVMNAELVNATARSAIADIPGTAPTRIDVNTDEAGSYDCALIVVTVDCGTPVMKPVLSTARPCTLTRKSARSPLSECGIGRPRVRVGDLGDYPNRPRTSAAQRVCDPSAAKAGGGRDATFETRPIRRRT